MSTLLSTQVLGQGSDAGSQAAGVGTTNGDGSGDKPEDSEDLSAIAEEKVELLCNDQVRQRLDCPSTL